MILVFFSSYSAKFQLILDCFIPNFKLMYEDSENVKADSVNTVVHNLNQTKRRAFFFGTPGTLSCCTKNFFFTISHLRLLKYWPSNFARVVKKLIFEGQYHYHSWTYHILDMIFFNCMRSSSLLSNCTFQMNLVAEICINKL